MSLSKPQKALLKRAQAQAGLSDADYREALRELAGVETSTDPRIGDDHLDILMAYFEAIYWRGVDAGQLQPPRIAAAPFWKRGYWAGKNPSGNTSRDRYTGEGLLEEIERLEQALCETGVSIRYLHAIRNRVCRGRYTPPQQRAYATALRRTLASRQPKPAAAPPAAPIADDDVPF